MFENDKITKNVEDRLSKYITKLERDEEEYCLSAKEERLQLIRLIARKHQKSTCVSKSRTCYSCGNDKCLESFPYKRQPRICEDCGKKLLNPSKKGKAK
ncbi:MAG: hypothetical protein Q8P81_03685 [Nanoarchaeota archaeon]|nr:hypothetical protein [Nanoarchaeota archaeon]